jgi:hypothetical protein
MFNINDKLVILIVLSVLLIQKICGDQQLDIHQILNLKSPGGIGCVLKIHTRVEECKQDYENRVKQREDEGFTSESEIYRQEVCCGYWTLRDCVAQSAREQCDEKSARLIENMKIHQSDSTNDNVLMKQCVGYEYGSPTCDSAYSLAFSYWTFVINIVIILISSYCSNYLL